MALKSLKKSLDYISLLLYLSIFFTFLLFNSLDLDKSPFSTALLSTYLALGTNVLITPVLYILSFIVLGNTGLTASAGIAVVVMFICTLIYRKTRLNKYYVFILYTAVSLIGYVFIGNTLTQVDFVKRIFVCIVTTLLSLITLCAFKAVTKKGLKQKLGFEEYATIALSVALFGLGLSNLVSPLLWKSLSVLIVLFSCYLFRSGTCVLFSCVLGTSLAIYYSNINYVSIFLILSISAESLMPISRHASAILLCFADYGIFILFGIYGAYTVWEFVSVISASIVFCILPTSILKKLKERLYLFRDKHLVRQTINRNRLMLSNKLYELSGVFTEMSNAFNAFEKNTLTEDGAKNAIQKQIRQTLCGDCENNNRCKEHSKIIDKSITKLIDIGFAKGKITLIDLPRDLSEKCTHPNNILYGLNRLLADYRSYRLENINIKNGRDLIASEASGIAEILRVLALETGATLKYQSNAEKKLSENLFKAGFVVSEILIYGEEERLCISMIVCMREFSHTALQNVVSKTFNKNMLLSEKADITEDKCYLSFKKAADYDAIFGIAQATKDGSEMSGDTHSVTRISGDRFLLALSDGMGSGEKAQAISSSSLSLIETFYKAGLSAPLILNTVNKLLAINTEDSFSALDISVIDLKNCTADFIKYGSPYGFIIGENGIRIVQGSSLPLGIIDDLKPSVCSSTLSDGDVILLLSDGISDAFGSSGDIIDFLRTLPAKNPQTLANQVLEQAIKISNGQKKDDMTALAVRVFKCPA